MRTKEFSKIEIEILRSIGFYFDKDVERLQILDIEFDGNNNICEILLERPGLLIGKKGETINIITDICNQRLKNSNLINKDLKFKIHWSNINIYLNTYMYYRELI